MILVIITIILEVGADEPLRALEEDLDHLGIHQRSAVGGGCSGWGQYHIIKQPIT